MLNVALPFNLINEALVALLLNEGTIVSNINNTDDELEELSMPSPAVTVRL